MYLDENVLKILYKLPLEEDITEQVASYTLSCMQSASEALEILKMRSPEMDSDFTELMAGLDAELEKEDPDLGSAMEVVTSMADTNEEFKNIYEGYIKEINLSVIKKGLERNPDAAEDLNIYLQGIEDSLALDYIRVFMESHIEGEDEQATEQPTEVEPTSSQQPETLQPETNTTLEESVTQQ